MNKTLDRLAKNSIIFTIIVQFVLIGILTRYSLALSIGAVFSTLVIILLNWYKNNERKKTFGTYIENILQDIDETAHQSILSSPIPILISEASGEIVWYNQSTLPIFEGVELLENSVVDVIAGITEDHLKNDKLTAQRIGDKYFDISIFNFKVEKNGNRILKIFYFQDVTSLKIIKEVQDDKRPIVVLLQVDNFDDVLADSREDKRAFFSSEIDKRITIWSSRMNAIVKKLEKDKYIVMLEHKYLSLLETKRFTLLDEIRQIDLENSTPPTLSIGVAANGNNLSELEENAASALELALGRGGDQAVVKKQGDFEFYGGKSKAVEKRNKVKARIIANALKPIIDESERIFIMGHKYPDMDSYGSSIGMCQAALNRGKDAYIVIETINETIKFIHDMFKNDGRYKFISPQDAIVAFNPGDLLFVMDTHKPSLTESPELEAKAARKVLFDHHRRGKEIVENTLLTYLEPYASSTSELVTEVLQYMERRVNIDKKVAEALLAGIAVDTKNFSVKTGVRTFESAAVLRRFDADTTHVKNLFKDDISTFVARSNIVSNAEMVRDDIAISVKPGVTDNARLVAAQGADNLLNIRGVKGAFVVVEEDGKVYVSGRSMGEINVQIVCEKLGGGGHLTGAGAQYDDVPIEQVRLLLIEAINDYYKEETS